MGVNLKNTCVMKPWTYKLSWKEQTVLLSALRGCDSVGKNDITKKIVRKLRSVVLNNAGAEDSEFMRDDIGSDELYAFSKNIDAYPVHFLLHLIHASEVVGYCYENTKEACFFINLYFLLVDAFHMLPESKGKMHQRLSDGVETCCHKT